MKYIKLFEQADPDIRIGDYVMLNIDESTYAKLYKVFVRTHIAKIEDMRTTTMKSWHTNRGISYIDIKFILNDNENKETTIYDLKTDFELRFVKFSAHTIEELKMKIDAEKYNL